MRNYIVLFFLVGDGLLFSQPGTLLVQRPVENRAANSYACEAPVDLQAAISRAGRSGIESLVTNRYPADFWVQRAYIDAMGTAGGMRGGSGIVGGRVDEAVIARFKQSYDARPEEPEAAYLYAYALIHRETGKTVEILTSVTQKTPAFPTAWMTLAILHLYPNFYDRAKQRTYLEGFLKRCPDTLEPRVANMALQLDRSDTLIAYAKALRERIAGRADTQTVSLYSYLWQLESKTTPGADRPQFRRQVEEDLKFLEGLDKSKFPVTGSLLAQGYALTGNKEAQQKLLSATQQQSVSSSYLFFQAQSEWLRANPVPPATADTATRTAHYKKQLQFLDEWGAKVPDSPQLLTARFTALSSIPDTPDQVLVREGDQALTAIRKTLDGGSTMSLIIVARLWVQRGLELDRVPALVEEAIEARKKSRSAQRSLAQQSDLYSGPSDELLKENARWSTRTDAWTILVTAYSKNRRFDEARGVLSEWEAALDERRQRADEIRAKRASQPRSSRAAVSGCPSSAQLHVGADTEMQSASALCLAGARTSSSRDRRRAADRLSYHLASCRTDPEMRTQRTVGITEDLVVSAPLELALVSGVGRGACPGPFGDRLALLEKRPPEANGRLRGGRFVVAPGRRPAPHRSGAGRTRSSSTTRPVSATSRAGRG